MAIKVTNLKGTSTNQCSCGSWLSHWKKFGGGNVGYCSEVACMNVAELGGHVIKDGNRDWYVIPLCPSHNAREGASFDVGDNTTFVSANISVTCGRKGS